MFEGAINWLLLLVILVLLIVIHEFGHFVVARWAKVRVHEFGIGFPPRARVLGNDGETTYTLNWLPIGGFVRLEGEEGESDDPRAFVRQRLPTRLAILLAGVVMNWLLAFVIFAAVAGIGDPVANVRVAVVEPGAPAAQAGLQGSNPTVKDDRGRQQYDDTGDVIVAVDGRRFAQFDDLANPVPSLSYLRAHAGQRVTLTILSADGTQRDVPVTLRVPGPDEGPLGILVHPRLVPGELHHDPLTAVALGARRTFDASTLVLRALGAFITDLSNPQVSGPVGIADAIGVVRAEAPPVVLLWLVGLLSANLAVINALPFPPLDGGRVAVSIIRALSGNRFSVAAERLAYLVGFIVLMALLAWVTFFDLFGTQRLGGGG
jgi:regulator of sigma E protease